jgi:hypothetical protein
VKRRCSISTGIQVWLLAERTDTILMSKEQNKLGNMVHATLSLQNVGPAKFNLHVVAYATSVQCHLMGYKNDQNTIA